MTIYKKIFLTLIVSFVFINIFNIGLDYIYQNNELQIEVENKLAEFDSCIIDIARQYNEEYIELNADHLKKDIADLNNNSIVEPSYDYNKFGIVLLDQNFQEIENEYIDQGPAKMDMVVITGDNSQERYLSFTIENKEFYQMIETYIQANYDLLGIWDIDYKEDRTGDKEITYLKSQNNEIDYGMHDTDQEVFQTELIYFETQNILWKREDIVGHDYKEYYYQYSQIKQNLLNQLDEHRENIMEYNNNPNQRNALGYKNIYNDEGNICAYHLTPLINTNKNYSPVDNIYSINDFDGYILYYLCEIEGHSHLLDIVIKQKIPIYMISFLAICALSFLLSHTFSERIKKMRKDMLLITSGQADIHLDENPNDELGQLSHHINLMYESLKKTIEELNNEIEHVKQLENVKQQFLANFTHEIKTPLAIINGYIELIHEIDDEKKKEVYLTSIEKEIDRIDELVKAMLNLSKLESGKIELNITDIYLDDMMTTVIDSMASLIQRKKLHLNIQGQDGIIQVDEFEFSIVIQNLLSNAVKHTPQDGTIYLNYNTQYISIENEGSSLSKEQMEHIWDTYVSSDREGTGLGLAICRSILCLHQLTYDVKNTEKGVCFTIYL